MAKTTLTIVLATLALAASACCRAGPTIYVYGDERGVAHLSDVREDARYQPLAGFEARSPPAPVALAKAKAPRVWRYTALVEDAAHAYGVDPALVHAVIGVESGYNARALSSAGAAGLMQLMATTAARYGVTDVFDPAQNVRAGTQHLQELLLLFDNDLELALAAYNAGVAAVERYGRKIPPYRETLDYVPRVLRAYVQNSAGR